MGGATGRPWFRDAWVTDFYDIPLAGYCRWFNDWCYFKLDNADESFEDHEVPRVYGVYRISKLAVLRSLYRHALFYAWLVLRWKALYWLVYGSPRKIRRNRWKPELLERIGELRPDDKPFKFPSPV